MTGGPRGSDPSAQQAAKAIRVAIKALERERPDLARRLRELLAELEREGRRG